MKAVRTLPLLLLAHCSSNGAAPTPEGTLDASLPVADAGAAVLDASGVKDVVASPDAPPASCTDGQKNAAESDVDCGGADCPKCSDGKACGSASDCTTGVCQGGRCKALCDDGIKNGTETDVDCGGSCKKCSAGLGCGGAADCKSATCAAGDAGAPRCQATCNDGEKNGDESDVDCGGACKKCSAGALCSGAGDCKSGACTSGDGGPSRCEANCSDDERNGTETDIDCGGSCGPCETGQECLASGDCKGLACTAHVCQLPSCIDDVKNGTETAKDCGGASCKKCNDLLACLAPSDCKSGVCETGLCISCKDKTKNGSETDVDCGGASCQPCDDGQSCKVGADCIGRVCTGDTCEVALRGTGTALDPYTTKSPLASCGAYHTAFPAAGTAFYRIKPGTSPLVVGCEMTITGGGWMSATDAALATLEAGPSREYLYVSGTTWYRSPATTLVWSWTTAQELSGSYTFFNGSTTSSANCGGSGEKPQFGIGCSTGGGANYKVLPYYTSSATTGQCTVCQDVPNVFGGAACTPNVSIYVR